MGKRIIIRKRGRGTPVYRVRRKAFSIKLSYPNVEGKGEIVDIIHNVGHHAPLAKIKVNGNIFYNIAPIYSYVGQEIEIGKNAKPEPGNILPLSAIPIGSDIFNIEILPNDGGKLVRASCAKVVKKEKDKVTVLLPSKKEKDLHPNSRATIGVPAGGGRIEKPFGRAGNKWYKMKALGKLYPRTSAVKMNAYDHPFGGGRGKHIKSKIAHWNAPPGAKVGLIRPRRTGRKKK
ncbi:MAG: 50S ribosomal protein L2 [Candidatus Pacearchaeota archaeon]